MTHSKPDLRKSQEDFPRGRDEFVMAWDYVKQSGPDIRKQVILARFACLPFVVIGAIASWCWADAMFGARSGIVALLLWCFSPYILGHGTLIISDVASGAVAVTALWLFWRWLKRPRTWEALFAGLAIGLAASCKFTILILYPLLPILWLLHRWAERGKWRRCDWLRQGGMLMLILCTALYVINCAYLFEGSFVPLETLRFHSAMGTGRDSLYGTSMVEGNRFSETWIGKLPVPLPARMVEGIDIQRCDFEQGLPSYLRGQWAEHGWWYYYLYALAVKVPLGTWCLAILAVASTAGFGRGYSVSWHDEMVVLVPGLVIFIFVSSQTGFSVHSRYILPALPFLSIWISKVGRASAIEVQKDHPRSTKYVRVMTVIMLGWTIASSLWAYPHSLSYFNELAVMIRTPHDADYPTPIPSSAAENKTAWQKNQSALDAWPHSGPRHLLDSNIDWGQDLFYFERWCAKHPKARPMRVAYWGTYPLELTSINSAGEPPIGPNAASLEKNDSREAFGPLHGWYALSVNEIYARHKRYRHFLFFEPVATAGYSIYIYHVTLEDANRVRCELGLPELSEDWEPGGNAHRREGGDSDMKLLAE
ncbi:MAG: glycosyltransferase family 39 protein [Chloroflexi bacterium]|nr:glycosyltransferase family 39 protein [Chloroflexota bacterium]